MWPKSYGFGVVLAGGLLIPNGLALSVRCSVRLPGQCVIYSAGREGGIVLSLAGLALALLGVWMLSRDGLRQTHSEPGRHDKRARTIPTRRVVQAMGLFLLLASLTVNFLPVPERVIAFHDSQFSPDNPYCRVSPAFSAAEGDVVEPSFYLYFVGNGTVHDWGRAIGSVVPASQAEVRPCLGGLPFDYIPEDGAYVFYVGHYGSFPWPNYTMVVDGTVTIRSPDGYLAPQLGSAGIGSGLVLAPSRRYGKSEPGKPVEDAGQ